MAKPEMTGRERILTTLRHEEPDRVPISPRVQAWLMAEYGDASLATLMEKLPDMDLMHIVGDGTPNTIDSYPEDYDLPGVQVDQRKYSDGDKLVVERTFYTPAGDLSDRTIIPPAGREYGVSPNPFRTEHLVKEAGDLDALCYLLKDINTNFDFLRGVEELVGDRGVVMVCIRGALDHHAGYARGMQDLMMDYYGDRALFDDLLWLFHRRSMAQARAALEGGAEFIFGSWYFHSLSVGWSPDLFEKVFVPQIREHVELAHEYGAYYDYYDDGRLMGSLEMIARTGADVIETCTPPPVGDFDLAEAKRRVGGRTTLKGYVDLLYVIKHGTPDLVTRTVREAMEVGKPGGGFIIGSSDSFREGTPKENIAAYFEACRRYGVY